MLRIENVTKRFGDAYALRNVSLEVQQGEILALLGLSGSGKSTLLNCVAGIVAPEEGSISIGGLDVATIHPYDRGAEVVFQNLGLFPYLSVRENIARGAKKHSSIGIAQATLAAARAGHVPESLLDKMIQNISGGERQRVALARSFAALPQVWLLDEPLSSVDAVLRLELCKAIVELHQELKCATIYVTHDRNDAFRIANRIGIIHNGILVQIGDSEEVYSSPRTVITAQLTGDVNIFAPQALPHELREKLHAAAHGNFVVGIRPENIYVAEGASSFKAVVRDSRSVAGIVHTRVSLFGSDDCVVHTATRLNLGDSVCLNIQQDHFLVLKDDRVVT